MTYLKAVAFIAVVFGLYSWLWESDKYQLSKYYKNGSYAGVVETYETLDECLADRDDATNDDKEIGYANSIFKCEKIR